MSTAKVAGVALICVFMLSSGGVLRAQEKTEVRMHVGEWLVTSQGPEKDDDELMWSFAFPECTGGGDLLVPARCMAQKGPCWMMKAVSPGTARLSLIGQAHTSYEQRRCDDIKVSILPADAQIDKAFKSVTIDWHNYDIVVTVTAEKELRGEPFNAPDAEKLFSDCKKRVLAASAAGKGWPDMWRDLDTAWALSPGDKELGALIAKEKELVKKAFMIDFSDACARGDIKVTKQPELCPLEKIWFSSEFSGKDGDAKAARRIRQVVGFMRLVPPRITFTDADAGKKACIEIVRVHPRQGKPTDELRVGRVFLERGDKGWTVKSLDVDFWIAWSAPAVSGADD